MCTYIPLEKEKVQKTASWKQLFYFHHICSGDQTHVVRRNGKQLVHLATFYQNRADKSLRKEFLKWTRLLVSSVGNVYPAHMNSRVQGPASHRAGAVVHVLIPICNRWRQEIEGHSLLSEAEDNLCSMIACLKNDSWDGRTESLHIIFWKILWSIAGTMKCHVTWSSWYGLLIWASIFILCSKFPPFISSTFFSC